MTGLLDALLPKPESSAVDEVTAAVLSSPETRDELADLLRRDLLGPWGGEWEVFELGEERNPRDRYIVGLLAPADADRAEKPAAREAADEGDLAVAESGDESDEGAVAPAQATRFFPSSLGLSFAVDPSVTLLQAETSWGRYERVPIEDLRALIDASTAQIDGGPDTDDVTVAGAEPPSGTPADSDNDERDESDAEEQGKKRARAKKGWRRVPVESGPLTLDVSGDGVMWVPGCQVQVRWRSRLAGGLRLVSVWMVNQQTQSTFPDLGPDAAWLFQAHLTVTATDGEASVFLSQPNSDGGDVLASDAERDLLDMLYRNVPEYAVGHGVATVYDEHEGQDPGTGRRAWRLSTESLPSYDVPQTVAPDPSTVSGLEGLVLDMVSRPGFGGGSLIPRAGARGGCCNGSTPARTRSG